MAHDYTLTRRLRRLLRKHADYMNTQTTAAVQASALPTHEHFLFVTQTMLLPEGVVVLIVAI